jgi:hypothetical protein
MTPDPEVAAAYAKLHEKMKAAGFPPIEGGDGKEYKPTSSTKMSHIKDMEEHFEHGLAHHKESEGDSEEGSGDSDNVDVQPSLEDSSDEDDTGDEESSEKEDSSEDDDPADDEVGEPWGYLNDLEYDDEGEPVGDDKPESKEEVAQLQKQVDQLTDALVQMEDRMEKHHQEMYKLLQQNSQQARKSPTKQRLARLFQQVGAFLNLVLGAAIGAAIGGPGGAIAGAWIAHQRNQIKRYRKQSQTRKSLIPVSTNTPTLVKGGVYYCPMTDRLVVPMTTSTGGSKLVKAKYHRRFKRNNKWRYEYTDPKKRTAAQTKKVKAATTKAEKVLKSPTKRKKMVDRFLKELTPTQLASRLADAAKTEAKEFKEAAIGASMFLHSPPPLKAHQSSMFKVALTGVVAAMAIPAGPIAVLGSLGGALAVHVAFKAFTQILTLGVDGTEAAKVISDGLELVGHLMKSSKKGDPKMTEAFVRIVVERAIKILEEDSLSYGDLHMIMSDNRDSLGLTKGLSDDFDLVKAFTTADVHAAADAAGVSWDNNPAFMDRSERLTGKRHLDDMTEQELRAVASNLKKGEKSARRVPPPPSSKPSRARRPVNEYGHRDGLTPGDCLTIRKSHVVGEGSDRVEVYDNGQFMWKGQTYPNGRQLLAAVTKNPNHHLTIRRYFHFGEK